MEADIAELHETMLDASSIGVPQKRLPRHKKVCTNSKAVWRLLMPAGSNLSKSHSDFADADLMCYNAVGTLVVMSCTEVIVAPGWAVTVIVLVA